ncbi:GNAT family N-acetyltransferase [Clostridium paridis]|uniref:GNAT family N-acetyltransferase n=1 Tax=Clostridium paridis TaxID=2803863 RepID=A0A937FHM5_9CLOT|nr:GNAT family protein [Clostridium paridis]MBL4932167.1 GNAT family N-acetyltransferase [Clostridium paridis]
MNIELLFSEIPKLQGENIILKSVEDKDVEELFSIYSNEEIFIYCGIIPKKNKNTVKNMVGHFGRDFNKKDKVKWGIYSENNGFKLVGIIDVFNINQRVDMLTLGYFLEEKSWGKGIATEAVSIIVSYLFEHINVNRINAEVMLDNNPSKNVLMKNGFLKEGTIRQGNFWPGKGIVDLEYYGLLKEDYLKNRRG